MEKVPHIVLIADDDEFFRIALRTILESELGFTEVIETGSLDEAVEVLSDRDDIILSLFDLAMPGMQSAASLEAVRNFHQDMKIAVVSSSSDRGDILAALAAGAHGYVPKGLGATELASALRVVMSGAIYVPPIIAERVPLLPQTVGPPGSRNGEKTRDDRALFLLTPRQREVLTLLVQGFSNKEIARKLGLGEGTVKIHMAALFRSLEVRNRQAAAAVGARLLTKNENQRG